MAKKGTGTDVDTGSNVRLKPKEVAGHREQKLKQQRGKCPLCRSKISADQSAMDHDHVTGYCRDVLHRNCNSIEGRILHWAKRSGADPSDFLRNLLRYWARDYSTNPVHPNHKTDGEKRATKIRRRIRKAKRTSTKVRLRAELKRLQDE